MKQSFDVRAFDLGGPETVSITTYTEKGCINLFVTQEELRILIAQLQTAEQKLTRRIELEHFQKLRGGKQ